MMNRLYMTKHGAPGLGYRLIAIFLALSLCSLSHARAQDLQVLTLEKAVAIALENNPDVTLALNQLQSAEIAVERAKGSFLPALQASASATHRYDEQSELGDPAGYNTSSLTATTTLNLFRGFADSAALAGSRLARSAENATLYRQLQTVAFETSDRFFEVLTSKELVSVEEENLESQKLLLEQIEAWYKAGSRSLTDLYRQQAETAQAELNLLQARRNLAVAKMELLQILALPPSTEVEALPADIRELNASLAELGLDQLYRQALQIRPDLRAQALQIEAAREAVREAKAGYFPTVDLFVEAGSSYNGLDKHQSFGDQFMEENFGAAAGLSITIPIFDRAQTRTGVAQARVDQSDSATRLARLRQQVGVEIGQALADYRTARKQLNVAETQLRYASQALAASEERFAVGASTWIEMSEARADLVQASTNEVNARFQVLRQALAVTYYRGDIEQVLNLSGLQEKQS